jgi:O-acetyl-ADP-ribose deacetylase (regulator of RNase III)
MNTNFKDCSEKKSDMNENAFEFLKKTDDPIYNHQIQIIKGDILDSKDQYIAQQCNSVTDTYKGLSKSILQKYPWANFYSEKRALGNISIKGDEEKNQRLIIGMVAQRYPGRPKYLNDSEELRIQWFQECLNKISKIDGLKSISFPFNIGCGLAGGNWKVYKKMLEEFALKLPGVQVNLYKIE